jgi:hypothetical protein
MPAPREIDSSKVPWVYYGSFKLNSWGKAMKKILALVGIVGSPALLALPTVLPHLGVLLAVLSVVDFRPWYRALYTVFTVVSSTLLGFFGSILTLPF